MIQIGSEAVAAAADYTALIAAVAEAFREGVAAPARGHYSIPVPDAPDATLLTMPAWTEGAYLGVKIAAVFPGNAAHGKRAVTGLYLLMDAVDGEPLALIDGGELTARRTGAASALAATFLARADAKVMVMAGAGRLARHLIPAHLAARPSIQRVLVWSRDAAKAEAAAREVGAGGASAEAVGDLQAAIREADIVSTATLSSTPLVRGEWLRPGVHLDLVGGFTPLMRECDDAAIERAQVFCDTLEGAPREAGDLCAPIEAGLLDPSRIVDLTQLCRGEHPGRTQQDEITLFKSVGCAAEDLAAAVLVYEAQKNVRNASMTS